MPDSMWRAWVAGLRQRVPFLHMSPARGRAVVGPLVVLLSIVAAASLMARSASEEAVQLARIRFDFKAAQAKAAIEERLVAYEQILRGGVGLFAATGDVARRDWQTYVRSLDVEQRYPGIRGIGFSALVDRARRKAHEAGVRGQGFPKYEIWPDGDRAEYTAIVYLEPFDWRNQRALGYDMLSEPVRRAAMARARDTGKPAISRKVTLVQETDRGVQSGFSMYLPVYQNGQPAESVAERRGALNGWVYAPFRMDDLMRGVLGPTALPDIRLEIFDGAAISPDDRMHDSMSAASGTSDNDASPAFVAVEPFDLAGRRWTMRFSSMPVLDAAIDRQKPRLILGGGILASMLFGAVVWALASNRRRARDIAAANVALQSEISERRKVQQDLEQAKEAADAASQAKGEFLANVSHELRTPLTLILAPLEQLIATERPPVDWRAQVERVQRNGLRLLNRVNDILDFSKAEAGKFDVRWEPVDVNELVSAIAIDAAAAAEANGCVMTWHVAPDLGTIALDCGHFEKILLNLVGNAIKFTPVNGRIHLAVEPLFEDRFEVSVTDSGIGVPSDKIPLLFERFQQGDNAATRAHGGTGIGLALVKLLAELMGGAVGAESEPGRGSRFFVQLPLWRDGAARTSAEDQAATSVPYGSAAVALRRARFHEEPVESRSPERSVEQLPRMGTAEGTILVADDSADMRAYIAELLRGRYEVVSACNGLEAWSLLQRSPVDVVVSDIMMPELDGIGLAAWMKACANLSHIPMILVTARGGSDASASGLESGADDYIAKPFSPAELRARVQAALRMGKTQRALRELSRQSGMAVLAVAILHNLGNVLSGVTTSTGVIHNKVRLFGVEKIGKLAAMLREHASDLPAFLARDGRSATLPAFLTELGKRLDSDREALLKEVETLRQCVEHAVAVLDNQRALTEPASDRPELLRAANLMDEALEISTASFEMRDTAIDRDYAYAGSVMADRHKVLQILLNLISNARHALRDGPQGDRRIRVRIALAGTFVRFEIEDNGMGIEPSDLAQLFNQGFTTKGRGHGYGLHSSATWAHEMGGRLSGQSEGRGRGATVVLDLPAPDADASAEEAEPAKQPTVHGVRRTYG